MSIKNTPSLYEFLQEAELVHYYTALRNILQVQNVGQLKYVTEDDLNNIGLSKPEYRRLKTFFNKYCPGNYASKLRKLLGRREEGKDKEECLLGDEMQASRGSIKVPSQHFIQSESVSAYKELGEGEFGVVQQGVWTDEDGMRHQVAIKCLSKKRMQNNTVEFMKEYEIMQTIDHNHIVRLYGVVLDAAQIMLITELAPLRSLLECLKESSLRSTFTVGCLADFCQQIGKGMLYLESKRLIHRDLAARNILVFSKNCVKISDFGLSRALGVGKDYYQTNFNVNLKLPIAWCAPECINFLKFTSASDVWAFGVTMWEMFSYGFQPWAALTGHQILETIDEPSCQRLDRPVHCPKDIYQVMENTWRHRPEERPNFTQLLSMLEDARPEQVQVIVAGGGPGLLSYNVGEILLILDKNVNHGFQGSGPLWSGVNNLGRVGLFHPSHTVTYLGNLPGPGGVVPASWATGPPSTTDQQQPASSTGGLFTRSTLRGSKERGNPLRSSKERGSRRKISRDMIGAPTGNVQHTGHVGPDGCYFGDVTFISGTNGNLTTVGGAGNQNMATVGGRLPSTGSDNGFPSWKLDSDASDSAPLLSKTKQGPDKTDKPVPVQQPRMGHAIGYLRKPEKEEPVHQYQSISDEETGEFGSPLDLGPSLLDEVFGELENYDTLRMGKSKDPVKGEEEAHGLQGIVDSCHKLADKVSTMTMSRRHKGKKAAFVRPIKASDERTLENAIIMANQIASKSMHDLDKRGNDDMFNASPQVSPLTPNSPSKKFTFKFPVHTSKQKSSSPTRHFTDEVAARSDMIISPTARDAYKALVEGDNKSSECSVKNTPSPSNSFHRLSLPPSSSMFSLGNAELSNPAAHPGLNPGLSGLNPGLGSLNPGLGSLNPGLGSLNPGLGSLNPGLGSLNPGLGSIGGDFHALHNGNFDMEPTNSQVPDLNPLPLPPKDRKSSVTSGKRHIRKNPLIIPGGAAASMLRRVESEDIDLESHQLSQPPKAATPSRTLRSNSSAVSLDSPRRLSDTNHRSDQAHYSDLSQSQRAPTSVPRHEARGGSFETYNDAFEDEIAYSIDALDELPNSQHSSPKTSVTNQTNYGFEQYSSLQDGRNAVKPRRGVDSDEVRIMSKVLGGVSCDRNDCLSALNITDWNVHKAIKIVKLKGLLQKPGLTHSEIKISLMNSDWDVARAAALIN